MEILMATRDIADACEPLQIGWPILKARFEVETGCTLILSCVYRPVEEQKKLYAQGRKEPGKIVTNCDGEINPSKHNVKPAKAIDVCVLRLGKAVWDENDYLPLGTLCKDLGLSWGGYWKKGFKDLPHVEVS